MISARSHHVSRRTAAGIASAAALALTAAPAHAANTSSRGWHPTSGNNRLFRAGNGINLTYHYYANGVNWDRPSGALFFFDGDGTTRTEEPNGEFARSMARIAAAHNKAFVFVEAPRNSRSWRAGSAAANVSAVREFATTNIIPTVDAPVLLAGYSGGAEFVGGQLLRRGSDWLPKGSGAVMIGGGGTYGRGIRRATSSTASLALTWVVGVADGAYATAAGAWSAKDVAAEAKQEYSRAGYARTQLRTVPGAHISYDIQGIVTERLRAIG